jgi:hypothetical protein
MKRYGVGMGQKISAALVAETHTKKAAGSTADKDVVDSAVKRTADIEVTEAADIAEEWADAYSASAAANPVGRKSASAYFPSRGNYFRPSVAYRCL